MSDNFNLLLEEYAVLAAYIDDKEGELKEIKKARDNAKAALMAMMAHIGITNAKSIAGHSVVLVTSNTASVIDADAFFSFVGETGRWDMVARRAASDAIKEYLDVNNELPPGIQMSSANTLRFTRGKN